MSQMDVSTISIGGGLKQPTQDQLQVQVAQSLFTYSKVGEQGVRENWLIRSSNVIEYRKSLYQAFKDSQQRYLQRKGTNKILNQQENLISMQNNEDFMTVFPKQQNLALQKRKLIKETRGVVPRVVERYFVVDDILMTYFDTEGDKNFKKHIPLNEAEFLIESKSNSKGKWHDRKCDHRVVVNMLSRQYKPVYYYTNDLNEAKTLGARIKKASTLKYGELSKQIHFISLMEQMSRFYMLWKKVERVYDQRLLKMISFQLMGINLIELANTFGIQRAKIVKFWSNQVLRKEKKPILRSTFKYGQIRTKVRKSAGQYKTSMLVRECIRKLISTFKSRKLQRHQQIQERLNRLLGKEESGFEAIDVKISIFKDGQLIQEKFKEIKKSKLKIDSHKFLLFETTQQNQDPQAQIDYDEFFEKNKPIRFSLEDIGFIATDFFDNQKGKRQFYTVKIFSKTCQEKINPYDKPIITPYEHGLDVPRRFNKELYSIKINSIELPYQFVQKYHQKGDVRIRLRQSLKKEQLDQSFYLNSRPFKIELSEKQKQNSSVKIDCEQFQFVVDKLSISDINEIFKLNLTLSRNNVPVPQMMKEFLFVEEFKSTQTHTYQNGNNIKCKIVGEKGQEFVIDFTIAQLKNDSFIIQPMERSGKRLLIGRYCLIDKKKPYRVTSLNSNGTVNLKHVVNPNDILSNIALSKITLIEKSGVNIYDLKNLPSYVENSNYAWVIEFSSSNDRVINIISSGIQERQAQINYDQRKYKEKTQDTDIEGKLMISVIEARGLRKFKGECNPMVKIYLQNKQPNSSQILNKEEQNTNSNADSIHYETFVIADSVEPIWVDDFHPCGKVFDLGNFIKDQNQPQNIKIEILTVIKKTQQQILLGVANINSYDLLDIIAPVKEKCLIMESPLGQSYSFLSIQTLFIPKKKTRIKYELTEDMSIFKFPEQYIHLKYLQKLRVHDYKYNVPVSKFMPNYIEKLITEMILIDNNGQQIMVKFKSPLLALQDGSVDKSSAPWIVQMKNKLCSFEEKIVTDLKLLNFQRPDLEEAILNFKYLWKQRVFASRQKAFMELQEKFWNKFLADLQNQDGIKPFETDENEEFEPTDSNFLLDALDYKVNRMKPQGSQMANWFSSEGRSIIDGGKHIVIKFKDKEKNKELTLLFRNIWDKGEESQRYADVYYLIQAGIPATLRSFIWKDLLNIPIIEYEERILFQKYYNMHYDKTKSAYLNYKELANKQDCLAFRQIDEDIQNYQFPKYYRESENDYSDRLRILNEQKRKMRNILRVQVMWSKNKKYEDKLISYSYNKGILAIIQRLLNIGDEEEAFWILNGIIRSIPRLFSTEISCLEGGRQSAMRYEMTVFKAVLRENLPKLCDKFKILGFPVENLIYDSITSFYATFFSSEVVLRLWDLIIFNMSNKDKADRRRAVWHILAPAYLILREKQDELLEATSIQQIIDIYNNGCAITYNPEWMVSELKILIKSTFVRGASQAQTQISKSIDTSRSKFSLGDLLKKQNVIEDRAQMLEQTFQQYEQDLSLIFNSIELENKEIGKLLEKTTFKGQGGVTQQQYLDYMKWRTHVMARFKKVALKNSNQVEDDLYDFDEPDLKRENLDLSKINILLHQISHLSGFKLFKMRLCYGKHQEDNTFITLEERFSDDIYSQLKLQQFQIFDYINGYNHLKIEIQDPNSESNTISELLIDIRDINANRFLKKWFLMKTDSLQDNADSYRFPFPQFEISFYLQTHTTSQHSEMMLGRNTAISQFINSIKRKLPDRIDIFNKKNESDFVNLMHGDFKRIIQEELDALKCFLPLEQAKNTINDNFNFINDSDFGDISFQNFQYLVEQCFFPSWVNHLQTLYRLFVKEEIVKSPDKKQFIQQIENEQEPQQTQPDNDNQFKKFFNKIKLQINRSPQASPRKGYTTRDDPRKTNDLIDNREVTKVPFSLRNFIVSLVLMSHCTVYEKLDILYDLFDWNDGVADGLDMNTIFLLVKTIFERNLYYLPSQELYNLIELSFDNQVSMVYQAFWSREQNLVLTKKYIKLKDFLQKTDLDEEPTIDVTEEVQETLNSYQRMFGTKVIDFNYDSSAFKNLGLLIKNGQKMCQMTTQFESNLKYRLVLFCQVSGERFMFEVPYDSSGQLIKNRELIEKDDLDEYLKRNINKLYLSGRSKGISKEEFMKQTALIPFLQDLIRVEVLYRDRVQSTLRKKKKFEAEVVILMNLDEYLFVFRFQQKVKQNIEGDIQKVDSNVFRILMIGTFEEDVIADLRERIYKVIERLVEEDRAIGLLQNKSKILQQIGGSRDFYVMDKKKKDWLLVEEYDRLIRFSDEITNNQLVFRLVKNKFKNIDISEEERNQAAYDCYSLYKHQDHSYEWRLCKIMRKEAIQIQYEVGDDTQSQMKFYYWIEFLHLRNMGQELWLKRRRQEILMSSRYAREQQRNFEQEVLSFIRETYNVQENLTPINAQQFSFAQQYEIGQKSLKK